MIQSKVFYIKKIARRIYLWFYWLIRNNKETIKVEDYRLSPTVELGNFSIIRKGVEAYKLKIGDYSYISGPNSYVEEVEIGKYCSIARNVIIGVSGHNYEWVTTSPIITSKSYKFIKKDKPEPQKDKPIIGNDVWVGINVIIMRGVKIGDGAVVASGSVVTKDVAPYSIVAGTPAKHIKYRFSADQIEKLLGIKWWDWSEQKIKENVHLFYDIQKLIEIHSIDILA